MGIGLRAHYVASVFGAPLMVRAKRGLIANISSPGGGMYLFSASYGVGKAGLDRLTKDMAHELRPHGVAAVSLWPGAVKTEFVLAAAKGGQMDLSKAETPIFTGRAVVALASDPRVLEKSGRVLVVGHTDDAPIRSLRYRGGNDELSRDRAFSVVEILRSSMDNPARLEWTGMGASQPLHVPPSVPENRARNRRVEIIHVSGS